jgi:LysM repeat protein
MIPLLPVSRFRGLPFLALLAGFVAPALAPAQDLSAIIASMREDIRLLDERTRALTADIEQLKRENRELRTSAAGASNVSREQFNAAVAELDKAIRAGDKDIALQLTKQMERLAQQTQAALDTIAKGSSGRITTSGPTPAVPDVKYPEAGVTYTVEPGDTLAGIAQKFSSNVQWIQAANKIADPRTLQVGQTLFIPQK